MVPLRYGSRFRPFRSSEPPSAPPQQRPIGHFRHETDHYRARALYPAAALAQGTSQEPPKTPVPPAATSTSPTVGGNPLVQVGKKPAGKKAEAESGQAEIGRAEAAGLPGDRRRDQGAADLLRRHLRAAAEAEAARRKGVNNDCRFVKEEDERLTCYNGFADKIPEAAAVGHSPSVPLRWLNCGGQRRATAASQARRSSDGRYQEAFQEDMPKKPKRCCCCATRIDGCGQPNRICGA